MKTVSARVVLKVIIIPPMLTNVSIHPVNHTNKVKKKQKVTVVMFLTNLTQP